MAGSVSLGNGSLVWVEDPDVAWIDGEIVEVKGEEIRVLCTSGKTVVVKASNVYPKDSEAPPCGVDDMTKLTYLHEPGVLQNLRSRYNINEIYTYVGSILIAVNPFQSLPHLYDSHMMAQYKGKAFGELSPHPFAVADAAYRQMINEGKSQSILVSGESGAGKTEIKKQLMHYLACMGGTAGGKTVEKKVLESNPVLEAFGNAKTARNNNASRFSKFVEIQFDNNGRISGAKIRTYLLERTRVCYQSNQERNYRCFYMLCAAPPEDIKRYKMASPESFHYLNQTNCDAADGNDDAKDYIETKKAMDAIEITAEEQDAIFRVIAAILHLGNIDFVKWKEMDSSMPKDEKSLYHLRTAAELFKCDQNALKDSLCERVIVTPNETIKKLLDPKAATVSRDALAKLVYSRLFDWLVDKINWSIGQDPNARSSIGVLDICGFESFKTNSFEQFFTNLTNEKLQQHFNKCVFKMEQEEYTKEKIDWNYIKFVDNQDILDLIEKNPGGIISLLDDECMLPKSTYETFANKLYQAFKNDKHFAKPKLARYDFTICHHAGDVTYKTESFLEKNKDFSIAEHHKLLNGSKCSFVSGLFPLSSEESSKHSKFDPIGEQIKKQSKELLETLSSSEPHFIQCVKPNTSLKPDIFENSNVLQQLRCWGVMEAIQISCAGYPTRKPFIEFVDRFGILAPEVLDGSTNKKAACERLLDKVGVKGYEIGKTKVFLRAGQMADLDARRTEVLGRSASIIQRKIRSYMARKSFFLLRLSAIRIQSVCRGELARQVYEKKRREASSRRIQRDYRMHLKRKAYNELRSSVVSIQAGMRGMTARNELRFRRQTKAAIIIQSHCRKYLARLHYMSLKKAAITTQCAWRGKVARSELRKLKMAARETGALQAAKNKLEKQVEELTWRLQLEKRMRADVEEAKTQENAKLQSALQEMQIQFKETKETLIKERVATKKAAEQIPVIQEVPVIDHSLMDKITAENEKLKALVSSLEKKIDETEKKYEETNKLSEERLKQALEAESKIIQLKTNMQRLEEKMDKMESASQEMQLQLKETKETLIKEREPAKKITAENEKLKALVSSLQKKIDETEKKYGETNKLSEERLKHALEAESKIIQLKTNTQRPEEKMYEMESESQILGQQSLLTAPATSSSALPPTPATKNLENGYNANEENIASEPQSVTLVEKYGTESDSKFRRSIIDRQHESIDALINCITKDDGFSQGKPIAAFTIYKCLLHWKSFEAERTSVFDRLIQMIGSAIEDQEDNEQMAYWLSNTSSLLFLLQSSLKVAGSSGSASHRKPPAPRSLFGRMTMGYRSSPSSASLAAPPIEIVRQVDAKYSALLFKQQLTAYVGKIYRIVRDNMKKQLVSLLSLRIQGFRSSPSSASLAAPPLDIVRQVDAKYPALLFKQQLTAYVEKIYGIVRDNLKKELASLLSLCIQAPRTSKGSALRSGRSFGKDSPANHWQSIIECLKSLLCTLKENFVPPVLVQKIYTQTFSYINVQLFNSLLQHQECCTFSNGEYVKSGLTKLELWCCQAKDEYVGSAWDELKHIRQAVGFLIIHQKYRISYDEINRIPYDEITSNLCPILSVQQLCRICTLYWGDNYNTGNVSPDVISSMRVLTTEDSNSAVSSSFLLDDNSSIPFSVDDLSKSLQEKDFVNVKAATELTENPAFRFLAE